MKLLATLATLLLLAMPGIASAHTGLSTSQPADGDMLHGSPETLELVFTGEVRLINLIMAADDGKAIALGDHRSAAKASTFSVALPTLLPGVYSARWIVMGGDGHKISGSVSFTVSDPSTEKMPNK